MLNETIQDLTFEKIIEVTNEPIMIIAMVIIWLLPIIVYILIASVTHARTSSGQKLETLMIQSPNAWIPVLIWGFLQLALFLIFLLFPFWMKWI